jgi:hypothetical protein
VHYGFNNWTLEHTAIPNPERDASVAEFLETLMRTEDAHVALRFNAELLMEQEDADLKPLIEGDGLLLLSTDTVHEMMRRLNAIMTLHPDPSYQNNPNYLLDRMTAYITRNDTTPIKGIWEQDGWRAAMKVGDRPGLLLDLYSDL